MKSLEFSRDSLIKEYQGYTKIPEHSHNWDNGWMKVKKWAVTEKVHGSCFCFVCSFDESGKTSISYAKRNAMIDSNDEFFSFRTILPSILDNIDNIAQHVKKTFSGSLDKTLNTIQHVNIYCELFGGSYPGIKSSDKSIRSVQSGIYYSPNLHVYAFDISITSSEKEEYLDFEQSLMLFKKYNLFCAEPLAIYNSYNQALSFEIGFNTTIPKRLGLPDISPNKAEGIVIRSMHNGHYLIKVKIPEFSESMYSENNYQSNETNTNTTILCKARKYMTKNRFNNAVSKVGEYNEKNKQEILDLYVIDIMNELNVYSIPNLYDLIYDKVLQQLPDLYIS